MHMRVWNGISQWQVCRWYEKKTFQGPLIFALVCGNGIITINEDCDGWAGCNMTTCKCEPGYQPYFVRQECRRHYLYFTTLETNYRVSSSIIYQSKVAAAARATTDPTATETASDFRAGVAALGAATGAAAIGAVIGAKNRN